MVETIPAGDRVAAQVRVAHDGHVYWCAGFYTVTAGTISDWIEHWVTEGADTPPAWRSAFTS